MAPPIVKRHKCFLSSCDELVKENKNKYHSRTCARLDYFDRLKKEGKLLEFLKPAVKAKRTKYSQRVQQEFKELCKELSIASCPNLYKLYTISRNRGYCNGWNTRDKRIRRQGIC